jgi:hypothetical protein
MLNLQVGRSYKTRGGWKARVIYVSPPDFVTEIVGMVSMVAIRAIALHEDPRVGQGKDGSGVAVAFHFDDGRLHEEGLYLREMFGKAFLHPADIIEEI